GDEIGVWGIGEPARPQLGGEVCAEPDIEHRLYPGFLLEGRQESLAPEALVTPAIDRDDQAIALGIDGTDVRNETSRAEPADELPAIASVITTHVYLHAEIEDRNAPTYPAERSAARASSVRCAGEP